MTPNYVIRRPTQEDIDYLSKHARKADVEEVYHFGGHTVEEILKVTPGLKEDHFAWVVEGKLVAMYGVAKHPGVNAIWMLATDEFEKYKKTFRVGCKKVVEDMLNEHGHLMNYVHAKHDKALKWLKWLGFRVFSPEPVGLNGELYCRFEMRRPECVNQ